MSAEKCTHILMDRLNIHQYYQTLTCLINLSNKYKDLDKDFVFRITKPN